MTDIKSERWPASDRNRWPASEYALHRLESEIKRIGLMVARSLNEVAFIRREESRSVAILSIDDLKGAMGDALDSRAIEDGNAGAVFVETATTSGDMPALTALSGINGGADRKRLTAWLESKSAWLVIAFVTGQRQQPRIAINDYPGAYIVPWTRLWLLSLEERVNQTYDDLRDEFGSRLDDIERVGSQKKVGHEEDLFGHAQDIDAEAATYRNNYKDLKKKIDEALSGNIKPKNSEDEAIKSLTAIFSSDKSADARNPISRILLSVVILAGDTPVDVALDLTRALLPEGEAPIGLMSEAQDRRWRRNNEIQPCAPPDWTSIFEEEKDAYIAKARLEHTSKFRLTPARPLPSTDLQKWLRSRPAFLFDLVARVKNRRVAQTIDPGKLDALASLLMGLRELDESLFTINDFVTVFTGNDGRTKEISVERRVAAGDLPEQFRPWAAEIRLTGDIRRLALRLFADQEFQKAVCSALDIPDAEAFDEIFNVAVQDIKIHHPPTVEDAKKTAELNDRLEKIKQDMYARLAQYLQDFAQSAIDADEMLRVKAAGDVFYLMNRAAQSQKKTPDFVDQVVTSMAARLAPHNCWLVLACNLLFGQENSVGDQTLGTLTLAPFAGLSAADFCHRLSELRATLRSLIGGAIEQETDQPAPFDAWADAVWTVAKVPKFAGFGEAIAIFMDDVMASCEIPWQARTLDAAQGMPPVLAPQFLGARSARNEPNLLQRLFKREPKAYLAQIALIARSGFRYRVDADYDRGEVERLFGDVFWVLVDEFDAAEAIRPAMSVARLDKIVWRAITQALSLPTCHSTLDCIDLVMRSAEPGSRNQDALILLDLYGPAVLLSWRFRALQPAPITTGSPEYANLRACLASLVDVAESRRQSIHKAFSALASAQAALVEYFNYQSCDRTHARHIIRYTSTISLGRQFAPPLAVRL